MVFDKCQQLLHVVSRADAYALKSYGFGHRGQNRKCRSRTIHDADQGNMSSPRCCLNGHGYSVPSDDIKDVVGTASMGELEYDLIPRYVRTRIDNLCGSQLFQARNLAWASGSYEHASAMCHRQLQSEQRDTAASLKQNRLSRLQIAVLEQRNPCGNCSHRQR